MSRGERLRGVLLDTLELAYRHEGSWPAQPAGGNDAAAHLVYSRPADDVAAQPLVAGATVALHEPIERHPDGVWVGYADGHLEFAPDAKALAECQAQQQTARRGVKIRDAWHRPQTQPAVAGQLKLKLVDPDGKPVAGARIGQYGHFGDYEGVTTAAQHCSFYSNGNAVSVVSDAQGEATIDGAVVFTNLFRNELRAPLWVLDEGRQLAAMEELARSDFGRETVREVRLRPPCKVRGEVTSVALWRRGRNITGNLVIPTPPGRTFWETIDVDTRGPRFEVPLPPGDFMLEAVGTDSESVYRFVHIELGRREINLHVDGPPRKIAELIGRTAPEFRQIKGWKNTHPLKLADLRGKVVILDFWGSWCGPCVHSMPELMKLYDNFHNQGLEIIAVHDDSVDSIAQMDQKLERARKELWQGRDLPFPVALDGGGETRIVHEAARARGATTAAYGVKAFPTTLLLARDGTVVAHITSSDSLRPEVEKLLETH